MNKQVATFGGGCFWCVEAVIQRLKGVEKVASGYAGGQTPAPSYREVCSGVSGHAEVVQVTFDADVLSYKELLTVFMTSHDPTQLNKQGADHGTQYRSTIMTHNDEQKRVAEQLFAELQKVFSSTIKTEIVSLEKFFAAEQYHQNYYNNNSAQGYCRVAIDPKIAKLRARYAHLIDETVTL